jgi:hypothetical protein
LKYRITDCTNSAEGGLATIFSFPLKLSSASTVN